MRPSWLGGEYEAARPNGSRLHGSEENTGQLSTAFFRGRVNGSEVGANGRARTTMSGEGNGSHLTFFTKWRG